MEEINQQDANKRLNYLFQYLFQLEEINQKDAYSMLNYLFNQGASNGEIADLAFDLFQIWSKDNSSESRDIIYDLMLLEEPGMELNHTEVAELINKLK